MNLYWLYDLPTWLFGFLTITVTVAVGLIGFYATRQWVRSVHGEQHSHNEIVGFYLGSVCLLYGITLGLLAVGTWEAYSAMEDKVGQEAAALAALYRDVSSFSDPKRTELQANLREYARQVIEVSWPLQRRGIIPNNDAKIMSTFQTNLAGLEPVTEGQKMLYAEAYREFDRMVELRRIRLENMVGGLPALLWSVVLVGAFLNIALTWFFDMRSLRMHLWMTLMFSGFLGLMIFLLAALDYPLRGEISVGPEAFELFYKQLMEPGK